MGRCWTGAKARARWWPLHPELARGGHLLCMPGTHVKWVRIQGGTVIRFQTALSGELYELLTQHSVLARGGGKADPQSPAFALGLAAARENAGAGLLHLLFSTRSRVVGGAMADADAPSYLSGLIVGADVGGALALFEARHAVLVCAPALAALYTRALAFYGVGVEAIDGDDAALAGLVHIHSELF